MKKTLAIILTVAFILSLGSVAFAETPTTTDDSTESYSNPASETTINRFNQTIDAWTAFYVTGHAMVEVTPVLYDERGYYSDTDGYDPEANWMKSSLWVDVTVYDIRPEADDASQTYYGDVRVFNDIGETNTDNPEGNMVGSAFFATLEELQGGGNEPVENDQFDNQTIMIELGALFDDAGEAPDNVTVTNSLTVDHSITADASLDYKQLPSWHSDYDDGIHEWFEGEYYYDYSEHN